MPPKLIVLLAGTAAVPIAKLVGLLSDNSWQQTWGYTAAAAFVLSFVMFSTFRSRVLTFGGKALKALAAMGGGQRPVG